MKAHDLGEALRTYLQHQTEYSGMLFEALLDSQKFDVTAVCPEGVPDISLTRFGVDLIYEGLPIYEHRIVTLGKPVHSYSPNDMSIGDRSSPRMHWRRGHLRYLPSGKRIPVSPALVGVAENGVISHEYRVRRSQGQTLP